MLKKIFLFQFIIFGVLFMGCTSQKISCSDCNIIFISLDALQESHVHSFGYVNNITPTIDQIANSGYKFTNAISVSSWTVPASMTWFTGVYPSQHKVTNKYTIFTNQKKVISNLKKLSPNITTLAEILKEHGYLTGGFTGDAGVNGIFGFNAGFDVYFDNTTPFSGFDVSEPKALAWIQKNKDKKIFLFLHGYDMHGQYEPKLGFDYRYVNFTYKGIYNGSPQQEAELRELGLEFGSITLGSDDVRFWRAIYDEKINRADTQLNTFLKEYEKMGLMNKTIFIITSDHGTELYEHKRLDHGFTLYDELIHVPLIIKLPNQEQGVTLPNQISSIDIMPTILELAGIRGDEKIQTQMMGSSLVPLMLGENMQVDAFSETNYRLYTYKRSVRTYDDWKYIYTIETGKEELYNLNTDPSETNNLITSNLQKGYELKQKLFTWMQKTGQNIYGSWELGCLPVYDGQCT